MINRRKSGITKFITVFSIILLVAGCGVRKKAAEKEDIIPVKVVKIKLQDIKETLDYVGNIQAEEEAVIYSRVSGRSLKNLKKTAAA
ncbi:MAG: hypothetical protein H8D90_00255 [Candidatus Omnitrophica bacterium]|nr:hypothetical protein [Candidatus Omnitrophota bacterium]